jgi:hypothetical protein
MTNPLERNITMHDLVLTPERTLGTPPTTGNLERRLSFGWDVLPATDNLMPDGWRAYAAANTPSRTYCYLVMICTFRPETAASPGIITAASLGLSLKTAGNSPASPIARKIEPGRRMRPVQATPTTGPSATLNANLLGFGTVAVTGQRSQDPDPWLVQGYGESQHTPSWQLRGTQRYPLIGDHSLLALVETVPGEDNSAEVMLAAEIKHRTLGITRYRIQLTPTLVPIPLNGH